MLVCPEGPPGNPGIRVIVRDNRDERSQAGRRAGRVLPPGDAGAPRRPYDPRVSDVCMTLTGDASSVPEARRFVSSTLETWGLSDAAWAAQQIIAELAGNCALHARTDFSVRLQRTDSAVRLEVSDGSPAAVRPRRYSRDATTGRGLRLVDDLSESWGVEPAADGKTVWVLLKLVPYTDEDDEDGAEEVDLDALLATFGEDDDRSATALVEALPVAA